MNPQIEEERQPEALVPADTLTGETEELIRHGFTQDEITALLWLRQWYQSGGSDRMEIVRRLEFIKLLVLNGKIEP
jgi:hypothetical protein